jgi:arylsulfatase A-like enzyme
MKQNQLGRREFLGTMAASALLSGWAVAESTHASRPNIVFILADDMGYGDLGCQNPNSKIPTPNLDRLATQGMRFTDAHAPTSVCTPTRYGILTGRYCWRSRLKTQVLWPWEPPLIEEGRKTVAAMLREEGYRTACIGKWHLGWTWPFTKEVDKARDKAVPADALDWSKPITGGPCAVGFDYYFGDDVPNFPPYVFIENDHTLAVPSEQKPDSMYGAPGPMQPGWQLEALMPAITRKACGWIDGCTKDTPGQPFFLYFPLTAPHFPIVPTDEFKGRSKAGLYGDWVTEVDWAVGEVLAALERNKLADNTLIVFTSDNGPENPAYKIAKEFGHYSMGELRGVKRDTWEGGHRIPFISRWPGHIPAGTTSGEVICLTDFMATVAATLDIELRGDVAEDSCSVLPALLGEKVDHPLREATVHCSCSGKFAIRKGNWVLIDSPTGDDNKEPDWFKQERGYTPHDCPGELYDLGVDLSERKNLYKEHPDIVAELKALLERYKADGRSVFRRAQ